MSVEKNFNKYADIASSAQLILECTMKNLIKKATDLTGKRKIVLTGGVALNCKMIHSLSKQNLFEEMIVPPSPGDSGSSIGAANFAFLKEKKNKTLNFSDIFLGPKKNFINKKESWDNFFLKINLNNNFTVDATNKLINGEIPRLASLTLEPDGTNVKAEPLPPVNTNKQEVKGAR